MYYQIWMLRLENKKSAWISVCKHGYITKFQRYTTTENYVSYIAKNKAREEIVNSLTYTIDAQYKSIQVIFNKVSEYRSYDG